MVSFVGMVVALYIFAIVDMNRKAALSAKHEIELLKTSRKICAVWLLRPPMHLPVQ